MLIRAMLVALGTLPMALPATAQDIEENEPLVMRLIFDDCLGYVIDGKEPFEGLATKPMPRLAMQQSSYC